MTTLQTDNKKGFTYITNEEMREFRELQRKAKEQQSVNRQTRTLKGLDVTDGLKNQGNHFGGNSNLPSVTAKATPIRGFSGDAGTI